MPPASDTEQAGCSKQPLSPGVQSLLDTHADWQRKAEEKKQKKKETTKEADHPFTAPPGMAPSKPSAGPLTTEQIEVVQEVLDETAAQVPAGAVHRRESLCHQS